MDTMPQMNDTTFGTFADMVEMTPAPLRSITTRLKDLLLLVDPDAVIVVRLGDRAATFGVGPKKMSEGYCHIIPHKDWVNLGFYQGSALPDPAALLQGTGAKIRHAKLRKLEDCENPQLLELIHAAVAERKAACGLA